MYKPPYPWDDWDNDDHCFLCRECGACEGYRIHNPGCSHNPENNCTVGAGVPSWHTRTPSRPKVNIRDYPLLMYIRLRMWVEDLFK